MELVSAQAINNKKFRTTRIREGYDPNEVDLFLDAVAETVKSLGDQVISLSQRTTQQLPTGAVERVLAVAQRAADEVEAEANHKAAQIIAEATAKAEEIERQAQSSAMSITADAHTKYDELLSAINKMKDDRDRAIRALLAAHSNLKDISI